MRMKIILCVFLLLVDLLHLQKFSADRYELRWKAYPACGELVAIYV